MFKLKLFKNKHSEKINLLIFNNYKRFDQIAKIYKVNSTKIIVASFNIFKFKKYVRKGLNFYNKKILSFFLKYD